MERYGFTARGDAVTDGNGTTLSFLAMERLLRQSEWGKVLAKDTKCIRFRRFKPKHIDATEWGKIIGANGFDLTHMRRSRLGIRAFLNGSSGLSDYEIASIVLAEVWHDCGEAATAAGDIPCGRKTQAQKDAEVLGLKQVVREVLHPQVSGMSDWVLEIIIPVLEVPGKLNRFHRVFTIIDHMHTGMMAWARSGRYDDIELQDALLWMGYETLSNHFGTVFRSANEGMAGASRFLRSNASRITRMFESFFGRDEQMLELYVQEGLITKEEARQRFLEALEMWLFWQRVNNPTRFQPIQLRFSYAGS